MFLHGLLINHLCVYITKEMSDTFSTHSIVAPFMYILLQCGFLPPNVTNWLFAGLNVVHRVLKMSTTGRNACVQTFAKVVDSFVNRCLRQVIPDLLQCTFFSSEMVFGFG